MTADLEEPPRDVELSLVRGDLVFRAERAIGLIPESGFGIGRRVLLLVGITWLPLTAWALVWRRVFPGTVDEPLLGHFGIHVRCLVAIPLLVVAEALSHALTTRLVAHFARSGLIRADQREEFRAVITGMARLRDRTLPWAIIAGLVLAWTFLSPVAMDLHEVRWAAEAPDQPRLGFGGWWFLFVVRPIYLALALGWLWRLVLATVLFRRIAGLDLQIVPTHADRAGGLGFLEGLPAGFSLVVLAASAVLASRWAHDVVYHGVHVQSLRAPALAFLALVVLIFLAPLLVFLPVLASTRRRALLEYSALVGEHGRLVRRRWITREPVASDDLLSAPEIGPVADTIALFEAVKRMRSAPIGRTSLLAVVAPAVAPLLVVAAIEVPAKDLLLKVLRALA